MNERAARAHRGDRREDLRKRLAGLSLPDERGIQLELQRLARLSADEHGSSKRVRVRFRRRV